MEKITWDQHSYIIEGKEQFLISGEFHYFRVPKSDWKKRLQLLKEAGGNCVATYVPWLIHEPKEGEFLFGDVPERDLEGFLKLCMEMDIIVVIRPGPYVYSELIYAGLPGWLCENYEEILARNVHGSIIDHASISYLHPLFLEKAKKWYDAVCPIIAKYMLSKGGNVAYVQIDNEMTGIHIWPSGGWDYNRESMGIGEEGGRYPKFLEKRYKGIQELNKAYGTEFKGFSDVEPFNGQTSAKLEECRRIKDYQDFYFETIAEYGETLSKWMRSLGIDCDIVHNSPGPSYIFYHKELVQRMGRGFLLGVDHYYNLGQDWDQNNPTPQHVSKIFCSAETLRLMGFPPTVMEMQAGSLSQWPPITSEDLKCWYLANIAFGVKGLNYYIFTGGLNFQKSGSTGDIYDYGAGVGANGSIRDIYGMQKEFGAFLSENSWLAASERVCDFNIGLDWEYSRSHSYFKNKCGLLFNSYEAWEFMRKGIMISGLCASFSPNLVDIYSDTLFDHIGKPLFVSSGAVMPKAVQERLVRFVTMGGALAVMPIFPYLDENFNPCTVLSEFAGAHSLKSYTVSAPRINVGLVQNIFNSGRILFKCEGRPEGAVSIGREEFTGNEMGWIENIGQKGKLLWLGFQWTHAVYEHSDMMKYLLECLGHTQVAVECDNPNIWTSLREYQGRSMLFIMNLFASTMKAGIRVRSKDGTYSEKFDFTLSPLEIKYQIIDD